MQIISNCTQDTVKKAAKALKDGHLVAFPTETVYGLGADANNSNAVSRIYSVKGRPTDHPLIIHISAINQMKKWAVDIPEYALKLARDFWPGPMTLILKRSELAKNFITGGQDYVGLRVPSQPLALALLAEFELLGGLGVAAPSANRFGAVSPTTAQAVEYELGSFLEYDDLVIDGGLCSLGIESSIIDCSRPKPVLLRPGAITNEMIGRSIQIKASLISDVYTINSPGALESHYSPKATVSIGESPKSGDGFIALNDIPTPIGVIRLASPKSIEEYAKVLYVSLRLGDQYGLKEIATVEPEGDGLAVAIRDRLRKAATSKK